jgi:hypothetical protein
MRLFDLKRNILKKIALILLFITSLFSLDITKAVELGLEKKSQFMDTDQKLNSTKQADDKLDIRLVYLKFLEYRAKLYITDGAIKKGLSLKEDREKIESNFLEVKSLLESIVGQDIKDINSIEKIDFSLLQNHSIENSQEINSLEKELNEHDEKKSNGGWNVDVGGEVRYRYDTVKRDNGRSYRGNEVELGISIVLSKNSGYENDRTIDIAKKRHDLEKNQSRLQSEVKFRQQEYKKELSKYKLTKEILKKYDIKNLKNPLKIQEAYNVYMNKTEALYDVYESYSRLLHVIE